MVKQIKQKNIDNQPQKKQIIIKSNKDQIDRKNRQNDLKRTIQKLESKLKANGIQMSDQEQSPSQSQLIRQLSYYNQKKSQKQRQLNYLHQKCLQLNQRIKRKLETPRIDYQKQYSRTKSLPVDSQMEIQYVGANVGNRDRKHIQKSQVEIQKVKLPLRKIDSKISQKSERNQRKPEISMNIEKRQSKSGQNIQQSEERQISQNHQPQNYDDNYQDQELLQQQNNRQLYPQDREDSSDPQDEERMERQRLKKEYLRPRLQQDGSYKLYGRNYNRNRTKRMKEQADFNFQYHINSYHIAFFRPHYLNLNEFLKHDWPQIELLKMDCGVNKIRNQGWKELVNSGKLPNLKILQISNNDISQVREEDLEQFPELKYINFGNQPNNIHNHANPLSRQSLRSLRNYQINHQGVQIGYHLPF